MTKKTKEAIKASSAIVLAILAVVLLWIYPLNQAGKIVSPPEGEPAEIDWEASIPFESDSIAPVTEDNLKLVGRIIYPELDTLTEDSARGTVFLVHGLDGGMETQIEKAGALAEAGYKVVLFDQRGFGRSEGKYYSGGFFEAADLQAVMSRVDLENNLTEPVTVWGEDHGGTAALRIWPREDRIDFLIAERPLYNGRDWQKRVIEEKELSAPSIMLSLIWWWMKQKSGYEIDVSETSIDDALGWAVAEQADDFIILACGSGDTPKNDKLADLKPMGGRWMVGPCGENGEFTAATDTVIQILGEHQFIDPAE